MIAREQVLPPLLSVVQCKPNPMWGAVFLALCVEAVLGAKLRGIQTLLFSHQALNEVRLLEGEPQRMLGLPKAMLAAIAAALGFVAFLACLPIVLNAAKKKTQIEGLAGLTRA